MSVIEGALPPRIGEGAPSAPPKRTRQQIMRDAAAGLFEAARTGAPELIPDIAATLRQLDTVELTPQGLDRLDRELRRMQVFVQTHEWPPRREVRVVDAETGSPSYRAWELMSNPKDGFVSDVKLAGPSLAPLDLGFVTQEELAALRAHLETVSDADLATLVEPVNRTRIERYLAERRVDFNAGFGWSAVRIAAGLMVAAALVPATHGDPTITLGKLVLTAVGIEDLLSLIHRSRKAPIGERSALAGRMGLAFASLVAPLAGLGVVGVQLAQLLGFGASTSVKERQAATDAEGRAATVLHAAAKDAAP